MNVSRTVDIQNIFYFFLTPSERWDIVCWILLNLEKFGSIWWKILQYLWKNVQTFAILTSFDVISENRCNFFINLFSSKKILFFVEENFEIFVESQNTWKPRKSQFSAQSDLTGPNGNHLQTSTTPSGSFLRNYVHVNTVPLISKMPPFCRRLGGWPPWNQHFVSRSVRKK